MTKFKLPPGSKVLITGATGFTGSCLTRKLITQNVEVSAIARVTSNLEPFAQLPIKWFQGDVFDPDLINKAMEGVNYIFHLATPFREAKSPDRGYYDVHVNSTQLLAKAALQRPDFKRFVHFSTIGIHGHVEQPPGDENCPVKPGDVYQETKWDGEVWLKQFAQESGLPITVVRPAGIYGAGEKRLLKIYKWIKKGRVPVIGNGDNLLHFIHVEDLTDFAILAATHSEAVGEVFICGSKQAISFKQMIDIVSQHYQVSPQLITFPKSLMFFLGDICEAICRPFGIEPPIYRRRLAFYTKDRSFNTTKMQNLLGFTPSYENEAGLTELAQWYLEAGWVN